MPGADLERFRAKAKAYLRAHQDHSPFIDFHHAGPNGLFPSARVDELVAVLAHVRAMAVAA